MTPLAWTLLAVVIAASIAFPGVLVAIARRLSVGRGSPRRPAENGEPRP